ncbi:MAG: hypothetical protein HY360_21505 [Verrucomicrobia bacterium]|nr:hypothetical protein [Verrucomicrobiota bacterium]
MKRIHAFSLLLGVSLGLLIAGAFPFLQRSLAEDAKKDAITQEELDKKLDEILDNQKEMRKRIDAVVEQTKFIKAAAGRF